MSAMGQKRKWCHARVMSALPLKTDIRHRVWHVRYVPEADSGEPLPATFMGSRPSCHTAGVSGWNGRPRLDKDERKIVHRHLHDLAQFKPVGRSLADEVVYVAHAPARVPPL